MLDVLIRKLYTKVRQGTIAWKFHSYMCALKKLSHLHKDRVCTIPFKNETFPYTI